MGMTIDNSILILEDYLEWLHEMNGSGVDEATNKLLEVARKYQKIEEIMHKVYASDNADVCLVQRLAEIRGVIEDGKTD